MGRIDYRCELSNRYDGALIVGNAYGVARYIDGCRNTYVYGPQLSEECAEYVRDRLNASPEAFDGWNYTASMKLKKARVGR